MNDALISYKRHRFPAEIIAHAVWLYYRFPLSLRLVEEMLLERGIVVSYETIRRWGKKFGPEYLRRLRTSRCRRRIWRPATGLRQADRRRRDRPDHPGGGRHRHRAGGDRRDGQFHQDQEPFLDRQRRIDNAWDDPYTIQAIGDLTLRLHAAQALLEKAGLAIDKAVAEPSAETVAYAQIVTAESKILSTEIAIAATNGLFELAGTRSTLAEHNLDRHWRNARTHTLHDPVRWKYAILGKYFLNGEKPPLHAWS